VNIFSLRRSLLVITQKGGKLPSVKFLWNELLLLEETIKVITTYVSQCKVI